MCNDEYIQNLIDDCLDSIIDDLKSIETKHNIKICVNYEWGYVDKDF